MRITTATLSISCLTLVGCGGGEAEEPVSPASDSAAPWFVEDAVTRGLVWEHSRGTEIRFLFPELVGSGIGVLDYDRDGDMDLYLVQSGDLRLERASNLSNSLFANDGSGMFSDVSAGSGASDGGFGMGCACADYDGDGWTDIYVTNVGPNALLKNKSDGTFEELASTLGVDDDSWGTSCAFLDYDRDGDLDLFVANYLNWSEAVEIDCMSAFGEPDYCHPNNYNSPAQDVLYRNEGDGTFKDVTVASGVSGAYGNGLGVAPGDFNNDGFIDVYVANDMTANQLWMNQKDGSFKESGLLSGCAVNGEGAAEAGMGVVAFDADNDSDLDLYVTHLREQTNTLYLNQGGGFTDKTSIVGLAGPSLRYTGFGTGAADFNQDGNLDLYAANGRVGVWRPQFLEDDSYAEPDQLYEGLGRARFKEVSPQGGTADPYYATSRGMAFVDVDGDADLDVVVGDNHGRVRLLMNVAPSQGSGVLINVIGSSGSPAVGALVTVTAGETVLTRPVQPAFSYCSSSDPRVHFGLGDYSGPLDIKIVWVDGTVTEQSEVPWPASGVIEVLR